MIQYTGNRDPRFVAVHRGGLLDLSRHRLLASWAADCAEHVLPLFTAKYPEDKRPLRAIEIAREVARAAGHAVATAHMADHELDAAAYAIKAVRLASAASDAMMAGERECRWQREQIPEAVREIVLSDEELRNKKLWSVFTC